MHQRRTLLSVVAALAVVTAVFAISSSAQTAAPSASQDRKTVWSGVYTDVQAERGSADYIENCSSCHGPELEGVANLKGNDFMERWREFDVRGLYDWISKSMPRQRRGSTNKPGSLSQDVYVDIIAHIFRGNGFPAGSEELTVERMKKIQIEGKDGPKPAPNGSLVQVVGCMTKRDSGWFLTRATEPKRTALSNASSEEELTSAKAAAPGGLQFSLANFGYLGEGFDPAAHLNERVQTKGLLTRQVGGNRISLTLMETLSPDCP